MELNTAAAVISYISKIEQESGALYETWASIHEKVKEPFSSFIRENKKNESSVKMAYYSVVSDALETGFSFKGLIGDVEFPRLEADATLDEVLEAAVSLELRIQQFYSTAARLSKSLLADVPQAMERVAKGRGKRIEKLKSLSA